MSGMDGVTLLTRSASATRLTTRIILSATNRPGLATIISHRFLSKPVDVPELGALIRRSCALHERTSQIEAFRKTLAATTLPSRPGVYTELNQALSDPTWQPNQVSAVVEHDVAMSAKRCCSSPTPPCSAWPRPSARCAMRSCTWASTRSVRWR